MKTLVIPIFLLATILMGCSAFVKKGCPDIGKTMYEEIYDSPAMMMENDLERAEKPVQLNTEKYAAREENDFKVVKVNPTSVFSVDVDKASYANVRRFLLHNQMPQAGSVRIEEMINYFDYSYPAPTNNEPVSLNAEIGKCIWNNNHYIMKLGLKAKELKIDNLPNSNFVFLIDVSGSMDEMNKLPLLVESFKILLEGLRDSDRVAIVTYAGSDRVALESTPCTIDGKKRIVGVLDSLSANGYTHGSKGIETAYEIAQKNFINGGNNRIILATDGDFNVGISGTPANKKLIEEKRKSGVFITVLGFGMWNLNDEMMSAIADAGNGNYYYIDNLSEAKKALGTELWGTIYTVAKDVKLLVDFNPNLVKAYRLIGYEKRLLSNEDFNNDKKDAGDMGAGHTVTALYEIVPTSSNEDFETMTTESEYVNTTSSSDHTNWLTVKFRYKNPQDSVSKLSQLKVNSSMVKTNNTNDFKLACIVAEFAQMLRQSKYCNVPYSEITKQLQPFPSDSKGYIDELKYLVRRADDLCTLGNSPKNPNTEEENNNN